MEARSVYALLFLSSLGGIIADVLLYPQWWILIPLFVVLVLDIGWGILETS